MKTRETRQRLATCALLLLTARAANAQAARATSDMVDLFDKLGPIHCIERGPSPILRARDEMRSLFKMITVPPGSAERLDSVAAYWDGPQGCRAFSRDSLAKLRHRVDSIETATLRSSRIQAIGGLRWSASEAEVVKTLGGGFGRRHDPEYSNTALIWTDRPVLNESATLVATIDERVGLVGIVYMFETETSRECSRLFAELRETLAAKVPADIKPREAIYNRSVTGMDQCEAVTLERGAAMVQWSDSISGTKILLAVSAKNNLLVNYQTSISAKMTEAKQWVEKRKAF